LDKLIFDGYEFPATLSSSAPTSQGQSKIPAGARRLDKETCQREGIYFDGKEEEEPLPEPVEIFAEKEPTAEEVVEDILSEILQRALAKVSQGQRKVSETSSQLCDHDLLNAIEAASLEADSTSSSEHDLHQASAKKKDEGGRKKGGEEQGSGKILCLYFDSTVVQLHHLKNNNKKHCHMRSISIECALITVKADCFLRVFMTS
jgi:hypothetical protein